MRFNPTTMASSSLLPTNVFAESSSWTNCSKVISVGGGFPNISASMMRSKFQHFNASTVFSSFHAPNLHLLKYSFATHSLSTYMFGRSTPALQGFCKSLHQAAYVSELTHTLRGWRIVHIQPIHFSWQPPFALGSTRWGTVCSDPGQIWWHPFYPDSQRYLQCSYKMGAPFLWT